MKPDWIIALENVRRTIQHAERRSKIADDPGKRAPRPKEVVVNSPDVIWEPIDRIAAFVVSQASWIHKPPDVWKIEQQQQTKEKKMKPELTNAPMGPTNFGGETVMFGDFEIKGSRNANGEMLFRVEDIRKVVLAMANELPDATHPMLEKAKDARATVNELLDGLGTEMTIFKDECRAFLEDIRQTRMSVVAETSIMTKQLREIRQFFLGSDYQEEIARLREFVQLCERLNALKDSGFLDKIADTMLSLAARSY